MATKKAKSFRISPQALDALRRIQELTGMNETACVEAALIEYALKVARLSKPNKEKK